MRLRHSAASLLLLACGLAVLSGGLAAQDRRAPGTTPPGVPQTDQQRRGEALFMQRCTVCHVFSEEKRSVGVQAGTELVGLFKRPGIDEAGLRKRIMEGVPRTMPGYRYIFSSQELDELMAYLKIR